MSSPTDSARSPPESEAASSPTRAETSPTPGSASPATVRGSSVAPKSPTPGPGPSSSTAAVRQSLAAPRSPTPAPWARMRLTRLASSLAPTELVRFYLLLQNLPEEDDADNDWDSTLGNDAANSTASISSSILEYRTINGRTYYSDSVTDTSYWDPNDQKQNELLDIFDRPFDQNIQEEGLKEAGFVNISKKTYPVPLSPSPKDKKLRDVGLYFYAVLNQDLEGATQFIFGNVLSWTKEEISSYCSHCYDPIRESYQAIAFGYYSVTLLFYPSDNTLVLVTVRHAHLKAEIKNLKIHGYFPYRMVYAQKPYDA
ncbi:hypothetical protein B0T09DRAFT_412256 [Sordaria sp. MPI-SDFR-AT-0083]|nr:hypothetical protein B0T09DRAFT_412256 [Sordaria sp. MPI-SDFR-AT-0083]